MGIKNCKWEIPSDTFGKKMWLENLAYEPEMDHNLELIRETVAPNIRPAFKDQYEVWQGKWHREGRRFTHHMMGMQFNTPAQHEIYIARCDFVLPPMWSMLAIAIIVPKGITVTYDDLGHHNLYLIDKKGKARHEGWWVPVFDQQNKVWRERCNLVVNVYEMNKKLQRGSVVMHGKTASGEGLVHDN